MSEKTVASHRRSLQSEEDVLPFHSRLERRPEVEEVDVKVRVPDPEIVEEVEMKRRVAFFWDAQGTTVALWLRRCEIPKSLPTEELLKGFWVIEIGHRCDDLVYHPGMRLGAVWIPPGRISSVYCYEEDKNEVHGS